jgi:hypothetical protein
MLSLLVVYRNTASYSEKMPVMISILEDLKSRWGIEYCLKEISDVDSDEVVRLQAQIREIPPQKRGRIISLGGSILPMSHSKRLNVENTPILILYRDSSPIQVYPHMLSKRYVSIEDGLRTILETGLSEKGDESLLEPLLQKLIIADPSVLEKGASLIGAEVNVQVGVADLVLQGVDGRPIVVEIKVRADDSAIGQISRIAEGYASMQNVEATNIRKAILCMDYVRTLTEACRGTNIELYVVSSNRII